MVIDSYIVLQCNHGWTHQTLQPVLARVGRSTGHKRGSHLQSLEGVAILRVHECCSAVAAFRHPALPPRATPMAEPLRSTQLTARALDEEAPVRSTALFFKPFCLLVCPEGRWNLVQAETATWRVPLR